uniref:Uncharacterized protein n=1 Tax=Anguilla anguilla TaxID=7936 RepID=A0A0E9WX98_ANGAN
MKATVIFISILTDFLIPRLSQTRHALKPISSYPSFVLSKTCFPSLCWGAVLKAVQVLSCKNSILYTLTQGHASKHLCLSKEMPAFSSSPQLEPA